MCAKSRNDISCPYNSYGKSTTHPADIDAYFSTVTWPDYPCNFMTANDDLFLDVPLQARPMLVFPPVDP